MISPATIVFVASMLAQIASALAKYTELAERIKRMVDDGRDPTPEEWGVLNGQLAAASSSLGAAVASLDRLEASATE